MKMRRDTIACSDTDGEAMGNVDEPITGPALEGHDLSPARLQAIVDRLLREQGLAVLATMAAGGPHSCLVAFAATADCRQLYFATTRASRKFGHIVADARVSLCVHNCQGRGIDFTNAIAVTAHGRAREIVEQSATAAEAAAFFLARHKELSSFLASPSSALIAVSVESYDVVTHFQQVERLLVVPP